MSSYVEGPNPLRPYYKPPSVGLPTEVDISSPSISKHTPSTAKPSFGSSARDILSDLDYSDYLSDGSPSAGEIIKNLLDQALWKYSSVLFAQPFEVAKTVLQVQLASAVKDGSTQLALNDDMRRRPEKYRYDDHEVCSAIIPYYALIDGFIRLPQMTPMRTLPHTLHPLLPFRVHLLRVLRRGAVVAATNTMNPQGPRCESPSHRTHLQLQAPLFVLPI